MIKGQIRRSPECNKDVIILDVMVKKTFTGLVGRGTLALGA